MWLCFNNAFVSVVQDKDDPTGKWLLIRARKRAHLKRLLGRGAKIIETPKNDYRWRSRISRDTLSWMLDWHVQNLDYVNFKDSVQEKDLHDMYSLWWGDHFRYQQGKALTNGQEG